MYRDRRSFSTPLGSRGRSFAGRTDFYREGPLLWLQVDSILREKSKGARSLDTFAADFFGPPDGVVTVKPYTYQDLVAALNHVVPYDWNSLLQGNLLATRPTPVSPGLEAAGWTVTYTDEPNQAAVDAESVSQQADLSTSIGLVIDQDGTIVDVVPDSAAGRAGLAPGSKLMGVNHRVYSADLLRQAIVSAETTSQANRSAHPDGWLLCRLFGGLPPGLALAAP